jgi:soluble lytic murein transglycosylase-like protein
MRKFLACFIRCIPDSSLAFAGKVIGTAAQLLVYGFWAGVGFWIAFVLVLSCAARANAESIPAAAQKYRSEVIRAARVEAGLNAPVAVFAAQLEQESGWNPQTVSPVGARGLGQFMPGTAKDMGHTRPDLGPAMPTNPGWAIRALVAYDLAQLKRIRAATPADAWAMALAAYNGGLGWVWRDQELAKRQGLDPTRWWSSVETVNAGRSLAAKRENTVYPRQILLRRQPKYLVWGPGILCEVPQ